MCLQNHIKEFENSTYHQKLYYNDWCLTLVSSPYDYLEWSFYQFKDVGIPSLTPTHLLGQNKPLAIEKQSQHVGSLGNISSSPKLVERDELAPQNVCFVTIDPRYLKWKLLKG